MTPSGSSAACGTCGSVIIKMSGFHTRWKLECNNGHEIIPVPGSEFIIIGITADPVDECGQCGADLFAGLTHHCPVGGNDVKVTPR